MNSDTDAILAIIGAFGFLILLVLVAVIVISHFIGKAAERKHRNYVSFFVLSILLSPLITALVVAALPFDNSDPRHPKNKQK